MENGGMSLVNASAAKDDVVVQNIAAAANAKAARRIITIFLPVGITTPHLAQKQAG
jgi:hypothetical protein